LIPYDYWSQFSIPSPEAVATLRIALKKKPQGKSSKRGRGFAVYIQENGFLLPIEVSPYQISRLGEREPLLRAFHEADRLILLGGSV
jgi:hypothetical protein